MAAATNQPGQGYKGLLMTRTATDNTSGLADQNWGLAYETDNGGPHIDGRISGHAVDSTTNGTLTTLALHHVVLVWNGPTMDLYIDGSLATAAGGTTDATNLVASGTWEFGTDQSDPVRHFVGRLDDFAVWTRALSSFEVEAIYV